MADGNKLSLTPVRLKAFSTINGSVKPATSSNVSLGENLLISFTIRSINLRLDSP